MCADRSDNEERHKSVKSGLQSDAPRNDGNVVQLDPSRGSTLVSEVVSLEAEERYQATKIAQIVLDAFNKHYRIFMRITREARTRFIEADWEGEKNASMERITLYTKRVTEAIDQLKPEVDLDNPDKHLWKNVKKQYIHLLYDHNQPELAETFFNSVFTYLFHRRYYNNSNIFVRPSTSTEYLSGDKPTYFSYYPCRDGMEVTAAAILDKFDIGLPFEDYRKDVQILVEKFKSTFEPDRLYPKSFQLQIVSSLFYRNKAAYIIGRAFNGVRYIPFVIPVLNNEKGQVFIDALVADKKDITNIFSFSRAYFMVDTEIPSAVVHFLLQMLPRKTAAEIYTSIGLQKQGKTEFYRDFLHHLAHSTDQLVISSGTRGMVMSVFTLPSYPFVFKVINDKFPAPKETSRKLVKQKYQLVKMHDRVGRMADTLEFSYVSLPLARFSEELLKELQEKIPNSLEIEDDHLIIRHLYIERRLRPLNLFVDEQSGKKLEKAIIGYGNAIKELAAANIFPGDLLIKNFGLTRHGRVIFYDYDEIELLVDCNFREIPPPRFPEDEMSAEPWYSVAPNDVFPEEFLPFLFVKPEYRKIFVKHHADLLDADFWQSAQKDIKSGDFAHVFPYSQKIRFKHYVDDAKSDSIN